MSNKCFVTKLANSVDKDNLLKLGELRMRFKKPTNGLLKGVFGGLSSSSKVIVSFPYESEHLNFVDTGDNNRLIGKYFTINTVEQSRLGIQVSEPYDREYIDVSFIPFYYLRKLTSQFSDYMLGFIDSNGNYVGFKPFKYTNITELSLNYTKFSGTLDDLPKTVTTLGVENTQVTGDISNLKDMVEMKHIGLALTQVTGDISNLKDMVGINYLALNSTNVNGDISLLANCTALTDLRLDYTKVTGDISNIVTNLTKLTNLSIPPTVTITDAQKKTLTDRGCTITIG